MNRGEKTGNTDNVLDKRNLNLSKIVSPMSVC